MNIGRRIHADYLAALALAMLAAGLALTSSPISRYGIGVLLLAVFLLRWTLSRAHRWILVFFAAAILLPPLPLTIGDSGPHPALLVAALGGVAGLLALPHWRAPKGTLPLIMLLFTAALVGSAALAAIYSGLSIAMGSVARALLFAISPYVFLYVLCVPASSGGDTVLTAKLLFRFATAAAVFACLDFYFQLPAPAGFEPQFIWLGELVIRRAQGLFYEASTLGNFCAFFLVMILAAVVGGLEKRLCASWELAFASAVFAVALIFSYSRASLLNVLCAGVVMLYIERKRFRWVYIPAVWICAAALFVYLLLPRFAESYWLRVEYSLFNLSDAPAQVLSGRVSNWMALRDFIVRNPWQLLLGIGYKTLPYSEFAGRRIVADNTYLDLLVETGIVGLGLFLTLNVFILRAGIRAIRSPNSKAKFFGRWITCFWVGELVQMFSGDLITYWRVLPIYFWVLAAAMRETGGERALEFRAWSLPQTLESSPHSSEQL